MPKRNLAWILIVAAIALLMWQLPQMIANRESVIHDFGPVLDARNQIRKRFVEKIEDDRLVRDAVEAAIHAMVRDLDDPHAAYMNQQEYQRFQRRTDGLYGGIGVDVWAVEQGLEVLSREPNSPAVREGVRPGDIITKIDGKKVKGIPLVEVVNNMLNGPVDSPVTLTLIRPDDPEAAGPHTVHLMRMDIKLNSVVGWSRKKSDGWRFMLDEDRRIAYIRLVKFTTDVDERLDDEMHKLLGEGLRGLILDLRGNTGGLLDSAQEVADRFLESGLIVRTSGRMTDTKQRFASREGTYPELPMVVLVNETTASAAEIVAGSLRDHGRAVVIGERTYGKGSVQEVVEIIGHQHGAIKLTTAYYYLKNGECIHRTPEADKNGTWGVKPNIVVHLTPEQRKSWEQAWREIVREPAEAIDKLKSPSDTTTSTAPFDLEPADQATKDESVAAQADDLISKDIQLKTAYEHLCKLLSPKAKPTSESPTSRSGDDATKP
jgi:carboxyl-terminal processing protease